MMYSFRHTSFVVTRRLYSTRPAPLPKTRTQHLFRTTLLVASALSGGAALGLYYDAKSCPSPPFRLAAETGDHDSLPLLTLLRTYFVYGLVSCDAIVDHAPEILDALLKVPVVGAVAEGVVRRTFFEHFVGGETAHAALPLLSVLRKQDKGTLFAYSVEVDEHKAAGSTPHVDQDQSTGKPEQQPVHKRIVAEMIRSIDVAADFEDEFGTKEAAGRRTWVAVKLSALLPNADALRSLSIYLTHSRPALSPPVPYPGSPESSDLSVLLTPIPEGSRLAAQDVADLKGLYNDLNKICIRAKERGVRVILDAEYSWYQPAIDAFGHALMERFNKLPSRGLTSKLALGSRNNSGTDLQLIVYVTYQAYLRRTTAHLVRSLALARQNNYALGVKLVRGAYYPHELAAHAAAASGIPGSVSISPDSYPPVQPTKPDTDACYHECAALLVRAIADDFKSSSGHPSRVGVLFGTHNWTSCEFILEQLVNNGLAQEHPGSTDRNLRGSVTVLPEVAEMVTFGQLYGMSDSLTNYIAGRVKTTVPFVIKYIPYGALVEVMPYIARRAVENKSVLGEGGAVRERKEAARLIWRSLFGNIGL